MTINSDEPCHVIVGGGLAGLFAARVLLKRGESNIYVIEKSPHIGGFLQSSVAINPLKDNQNFEFDYGTHFILCPDDPEIKTLLEEDLSLSQYYKYEGSLQEAHVLNGKLYEKSGCADIRAFSVEQQEVVQEELKALHVSNTKLTPNDLGELFTHRYGATAASLVYKPAYEKFTGLDVSNLPVSVESFFAPARLIIANNEKSKALKQDIDWDWRVAYADCKDGSSDVVKYYPKKGGVGFWLSALADKLQDEGVVILKETTVTSVQQKDEYIESVKLSNNLVLPCKKLIWSLPAIFLAMLTKTTVPSQRPSMRHVIVLNFLTDQRPIERPYWVTIYDKERKSYRVTLYNNFVPESSNVYRITVEVLHDGEILADEALSNNIFKELKEMGILDEKAKKLWSESKNKQEGFPIISEENREIYLEQHQILEDKYKNIDIVGRRPDIGFGQIPIIKYIYNKFLG